VSDSKTPNIDEAIDDVSDYDERCNLWDALKDDIDALEAKHAAEIARTRKFAIDDDNALIRNELGILPTEGLLAFMCSEREHIRNLRKEIATLRAKMVGMVCGTCKGEEYVYKLCNNCGERYCISTKRIPCPVCQPKKEG
jgi:hypothetical protein